MSMGGGAEAMGGGASMGGAEADLGAMTEEEQSTGYIIMKVTQDRIFITIYLLDF